MIDFHMLKKILLIFIWSYYFIDPCVAGIVDGIVLSEKGPLPEAVVLAYPDYDSFAADKKAIGSQPLEKPGQFHMELPPGEYFFVAKGRQNGQDFFSYHGLNPISISDSYKWLPFFALAADQILCSDGPQGIGGQVFYKGESLDSGVVSVYDAQEMRFRGMGLLTSSLDEQGRFWFDLDPGTYVFIARKRQDGAGIGPVRKGDLFCYHSTNPVDIDTAQSCRITISCYPRDNIEAFLMPEADDPRGRRQETRRSASHWNTEALEAANGPPPDGMPLGTIISGKVTDVNGEPVKSIFVTAYPGDNFPLFQMHIIRQKTGSMALTDDAGQFRLELDNGGLYYLVAREKVGEAPVRFEQYGLYEGNVNHSIKLETGMQVTDVHIRVEPIMP